MNGLIIKEPWIDLILKGKKTWEIRSSNTKIRGKIYLIKSGSGRIFGEANLINSFEININQFKNNTDKHCIHEVDYLPYKKHIYAWVLKNPIKYKTPKPYTHLRGAVIWVKC